MYATKKSDIADSDVVGTHMHLVTFTFEVIASTNGVRDAIYGLTAVAMTDTGAVDLLTNAQASVVDRDGTSLSGSVEVIEDKIVDNYARVTRSQIYATEVFSVSSANYDFNV